MNANSKSPAQRPSPYKLQVKKSIAGLGLFADEEIPSKRFVIEYYGPILSDKETYEKGGKYLFEVGKNKTVDGSSRKNIARYINHSCKPNCEVRIVGNRIYIYTLRRIRAKEELTYDYGKEYFDYHIKPYGCRCEKCKRKRSAKN